LFCEAAPDGTWSIMHRDRKNQYLRYLIGGDR
jgi:hypothetical protein